MPGWIHSPGSICVSLWRYLRLARLSRLFRNRGRPVSSAVAWGLTALALLVGVAVAVVLAPLFDWEADLTVATFIGVVGGVAAMWGELKRIDAADAVMAQDPPSGGPVEGSERGSE